MATSIKLPEDLKRRVEKRRGFLAEAYSRPLDGALRELVISRGSTGDLALYEYDVRTDQVVILALRPQREAGYLERGATE